MSKRLAAINKKIGPLKSLSEKKNIWEIQGKKIVFTNGCFDLLHRGHLTYLSEAAAFGDVLVIGLNSDQSVRALKGPQRPINNEQDRAFQLAALTFVDHVVIFDDPTPLELIQVLQPDVLIKGGDYDPNETDPNAKKYIVGSKEQTVRRKETTVIDFIKDYSSSSIIDRIKKK